MIKLNKKTNEKVEFNLKTDVGLINAIRRSVNEIPVLAVDTLEIVKNDSALYDEIIAHRVGLVPLKNENLKIVTEEDSAKDINANTIKLKLKAKGPGIVFSDELSPKGSSVYKIPIVILDKEQEIEFVAEAKMGLGIEHAKFSPGLLSYRYAEDIEVGKEKDDAEFSKLITETKDEEEREFVIKIETWGQMSASEIFTGAMNALEKNLKSFLKSIK